MSISSTRKISSSASNTSRIDKSYSATNRNSQFVENIDTTNNVLVKDEHNGGRQEREFKSKDNEQSPNYKSSNPGILNGIEVIAASISVDEQTKNHFQGNKVDVYSNNQSIVHDEDVEHTGRSYLKHFYEKNEHVIDVDELV